MRQKIRKKEVQEKKKEEMKNQWQDKIAAWMAGRLINGLCYLRRTLQKQEQRLTLLQKKVLLFVFCVLGSAYFIYLLGNALFHWPAPYSSLESIQIRGNGKSPPDTIFGIDKRMKKFRNPLKHKP